MRTSKRGRRKPSSSVRCSAERRRQQQQLLAMVSFHFVPCLLFPPALGFPYKQDKWHIVIVTERLRVHQTMVFQTNTKESQPMSRTNGFTGRRKPKTTATTSKATAVSLLLLAALAVLGGTLSFSPSSSIIGASRGNRKTCPPFLFALKRMEGESEKAFFQRITTAASDPEAFERMVASDAAGEPSTYATRKTNGSTNGKKNGAVSGSGHAGGAGNPKEQHRRWAT